MPHPPTRREIVVGAATLPLLATGAVAATADQLWPLWQAEWRRMEAVALAREWEVTPLSISPPVDPSRLNAFERELGLPFPTQLRELMERFSDRISFGWSIPSHKRPFEAQRLPGDSTFTDFVWDIDDIAKFGIPNFLDWKRDLKDKTVAEAPNRPEMWEGQFPISSLRNGDMLTIDVTDRDGTQPVRYFSHDLEGVHGIALAPDFFTFVTTLSQLGWVGTDQDDWFDFMQPQEGDRRYLSIDSEGAKAWAAWLAQDPANRSPDEPPDAIMADTPAERALLQAAEDGSLSGVRAALAGGARPDVVPNDRDLLRWNRWDWEFATALTYAVRRDDLAMATVLLEHGATINTRRLASNDAAARGSPDTLRWVLAKGGRTNGWRYDTLHPIHTLLTRRIEETRERVAERRNQWDQRLSEADPDGKAYVLWIISHLPTPAEPAVIEALLGVLLEAGADPDAPWDGGLTMLMWRAEVDIARQLIAAGARVDAVDNSGRTALHWVQHSEKARLLVSEGANINALSTPPRGSDETPVTPLQHKLASSFGREPDLIETLLDLGADPTIRDGKGRSTLFHCDLLADLDRMLGFGLDPHERLSDGANLLLHLLRTGNLTLAMVDRLLSLGLPIDGADSDGRTVLHELAETEYADPVHVRVLTDRGADKNLRDKQGRRPYDLAPTSNAELREALR